MVKSLNFNLVCSLFFEYAIKIIFILIADKKSELF